MFDKILAKLKDAHVPVVVFTLILGAALSWFHRLDGNMVAYAGVCLGALTGHAIVNRTDSGN